MQSGRVNGLERENRIVLSVIQALVGAISSNVLRITVELVGTDVRVHFVLTEDSREDREEFEQEFPSEVEALLLGDINDCKVQPVVHVGLADWPPGRPVFGVRSYLPVCPPRSGSTCVRLRVARAAGRVHTLSVRGWEHAGADARVSEPSP